MCTRFILGKQGKRLFSRPSEAQGSRVKGDTHLCHYTVLPETFLLPGIEVEGAGAIDEDITVAKILIIDERNAFSGIDKDVVQHVVPLAGR